MCVCRSLSRAAPHPSALSVCALPRPHPCSCSPSDPATRPRAPPPVPEWVAARRPRGGGGGGAPVFGCVWAPTQKKPKPTLHPTHPTHHPRLLAHGRKLTRLRIMAVDVGATVDAILDPEIPHALRLQAVLIVGVSTVHARQAAFLLDDAQSTLKSVMLAAGGGDAQTLPEGAGGGGGDGAKGGKGTASAAAAALGGTGDLSGALLLAAGGGGLGDDLLAELEAGPLALFGRSTPSTDRDTTDDFLVTGDASTLVGGSLAGFAGADDALAAAARGAGGARATRRRFCPPPGRRRTGRHGGGRGRLLLGRPHGAAWGGGDGV